MTLISDVLPSEQECTSSNSLDSGDTACSGTPDPIPQEVGGSLQLGGHEPNHESIRRPITGRWHPYAYGSEVKQGLPETSACFSAPEEFLIALTYGGESEWVKKVLADASLRLAA